ncbi:MAG TPA: PilZ domain-containing protein [Pyrinomonadaceae bacterium]|nr:PilZ domain-containing protein [Pyrinomonadaceae bacterium]
MTTADRRSGRDRREFERFRVNIEIEWEGLIGRKTGTISDISRSGCFVLSSGEVEDGENVKLFIPLSRGMNAQFWGEVVNHVFEIGFAVKFIELSVSQKNFIEKIIETLKPIEE